MTSNDICWALRRKFARPEWSIAFEVGDATGYDARRHADAIAMNCYPSRGLSIIGIEIKVHREDLKREIRTPEKAEPIARYCDSWWIAVPDSLNLTGLEVPSNWGIYVVAEDLTVKTFQSAQPFPDPKPVDRKFFAAIFRAEGLERDFVANKLVEDKFTKMEADFNERVSYAIDRERLAYRERVGWAEEVIEKVTSAGIPWSTIRWDSRSFANAVIHSHRHSHLDPSTVVDKADSLERIAGHLREIASLFTPNGDKDLAAPRPVTESLKNDA